MKTAALSGRALSDLLEQIETAGYAGANVTHPYKQAVMPLLDELSDSAATVGAVNTVVFKDGRRFGHNTDEWGFRRSFQRNMAGASLDRVVQIGAGGAGAATAHAMLRLGAGDLTVFDADSGRARGLADKLAAQFGADRVVATTDLQAVMARANGLVQATPVGMADHPGLPLAAELLRPELWLAEIIYFPRVTALLALARRLGCRTVDGGGMVVFQAARAFELFTGVTPDAERMLLDFETRLTERSPSGA